MQPVRWMKSLQKFAWDRASLHNPFDAECHLLNLRHLMLLIQRARAFDSIIYSEYRL